LGALDVIHDSPTVNLELDSRPECLTLVRGTLAAVAEALSFDAELLDDLKTAVSEACNNVVLHAYNGEPGPLAVRIEITRATIEVMVRDWGSGIQQIAPSEDRMGVGLAVISALADRAEFLTAADGGTEVRMAFAGSGDRLRKLEGERTSKLEGATMELSGDAVVTLTPLALLSGVLGRLARALAASARFSLDRFSDVYLVTDAIAAHAERAADGAQIRFAIAASDRRLELTIGPFRSGSGAQLSSDGEPERRKSPVALLADELQVEPIEGSEMLHVVLIDHREDAGEK
jgi:anti-sigma regulatory factor (Ser/Thr protein kinase)